MSSYTDKSTITEVEGDLFDAPDNAVLIHSCNAQGSWGAGIAKAFREKYPNAYRVYHEYCNNHLDHPTYITVANGGEDQNSQSARRVRLPIGTALIIPPQRADYQPSVPRSNLTGCNPSPKHWIVCLFTSEKFGKGLSSKNVILENTKLALHNMTDQLQNLKERDGVSGEVPGEVRSCRFNSGLFKVPWNESRKLLEDTGLDVIVVRPPGEPL